MPRVRSDDFIDAEEDEYIENMTSKLARIARNQSKNSSNKKKVAIRGKRKEKEREKEKSFRISEE